MNPKMINFIDPATYKTIMETMPIVTVDVLFFNTDFSEVILFKRNNEPLKNEYFTPGGRLFKNEEFVDAAVRRMKQELGLFIEKEKLIFGSVINERWENSIFDNVSYHTVNICFGYCLDKNKVKFHFDDQHDKFKWFSIEDPSLHALIKKRIHGILQNSSFKQNGNSRV